MKAFDSNRSSSRYLLPLPERVPEGGTEWFFWQPDLMCVKYCVAVDRHITLWAALSPSSGALAAVEVVRKESSFPVLLKPLTEFTINKVMETFRLFHT